MRNGPALLTRRRRTLRLGPPRLHDRRRKLGTMGLFDPNRWPEPYPMLTSWKRVAIGALVLVAVVVGLLIVLPAIAD
jgi:hypothetical protein